jgi:hypothetical protein
MQNDSDPHSGIFLSAHAIEIKQGHYSFFTQQAWSTWCGYLHRFQYFLDI